MAAPHVSGAAALIASQENPNSLEDVEAIREVLLEEGNSGWTDTSGDGIQEPLLDISDEETFKLVGPPAAITEPATDIKPTEVLLNALVNPNGVATIYHFEYGQTTAYGSSVPSPSENIGAETKLQTKSAIISGLSRATIYHFRVVAESSEGTTYGKDQVFETPFVPPVWSASYGSSGEGPNQFDRPFDVAIDNEGNLWVADERNNHRVVKLSAFDHFLLMVGKKVNKTKVAEEGSSEAEQNLCTDASGDECGKGTGFERPDGIAIAPQGDIWVSESYYSHVKHYSPDGELLGEIGTHGSGEGEIDSPRGIDFDAEGNLVIADQDNNRIVELNQKGEFVSQFGTEGNGDGQFISPSGVAVDPTGAIWVADTGNHRVQKFDDGTKFLGAFGSEGTSDGEFKYPYGIGADSQGTIWVVDSFHDRIQALNGEGEYLMQFGKYGSEDGQFYIPKGVGFNSRGDIWIADNNNDRIQKWIFPEGSPDTTTKAATDVSLTSADLNATINPRGQSTTYQFEYDTAAYKEGGESHGVKVPIFAESVGSGVSDVEVSEVVEGLESGMTYHFRLVATNEGGTSKGADKTVMTRPNFSFAFGKEGSGEGQFDRPAGVAVDTNGDLWVVDMGNARVEKFNKKGEFIFAFGKEGSGEGQFKYPAGIAVDSNGNVWVADAFNNRVEKFNEDGEFLFEIKETGAEEGQFFGPEGVAVDAGDNVWVADTYKSRLLKFDEEGEFLEAVGSQGTKPGQLGNPTDIEIGPEGNIWVSEWSNQRISQFNEAGEFVQLFGEAGSGDGQFERPDAINVDENGNVWVLDEGNARVQHFNEEGTYLGKFGSKGTGEGQFRFHYPAGIATDAEEGLWVADSLNSRLQKWE